MTSIIQTDAVESVIQIRPITSKEIYPIRRAVLYPAGPDEMIYIPGDDRALHFGAYLTSLQVSVEQAQPNEKGQLTAVISLFNEDFPSHLYPSNSNSGLTLNSPDSGLSSTQPDSDVAALGTDQSRLTCAGSQALRFRKFACLKEFQNRGIGSELFRLVLDYAKNNSATTTPQTTHHTPRMVWCAARSSAKDWYIKRGMKVYGDAYLKNDIEYVIMGIII